MRPEDLPLLEVFVRTPPAGLDAAIALEVTLVSLRAAQAAGYRLAVTLACGQAATGADLSGLDVRIIGEPEEAGHLALASLAQADFYLVLEAGQAFPWTVAPHRLFQQGKAVFHGRAATGDDRLRRHAALLSGVAAPTAVLAPQAVTIYATMLAERALVLLRSMHGTTLEAIAGTSALATEPALYALMNEDRMHTAHVLVESDRSPLQGITEGAADTTSPERLYARLRGI